MSTASSVWVQGAAGSATKAKRSGGRRAGEGARGGTVRTTHALRRGVSVADLWVGSRPGPPGR
eukprot:scaffold22550_cov163-Isochrysis_galbana.AAC.4